MISRKRRKPAHRFDMVAYDRNDKPVLLVEVKRVGDIRTRARLLEDTSRFVETSRDHAPFFLIAETDEMHLFRFEEPGSWPEVAAFDTREVLRHYDQDYGSGPVYESYLASLVEVWLNDLAYNWKEGAPPKRDVFEGLDLLSVLREGSLAVDATQ